nr:primase C-terminal domain-containing protein [Roseivivax sp. GX 12232]
MSREPLRQAQPISDDRSSSHTSQEERTRETYARAQTNYFDESHALAGRNSKAFESVRGLVYAAKSQCNTEYELREYALNELELFNALNNWHDPLPDKELRYLARSMASWTWRKYTAPGGHIDRGVCRREGLMPHVATNKTKQAVGGVYGAKKNAQNKLELIKEARLQMIDRGEEVTVSALARDVSMSRNTVRKHLRAIDDDAQNQAIAECKQLLETHNWVVKTVAIRKRYIENSFGNGPELHRSASQRAEQSLWDHIDAEENGSPAVSCVSGEEMMAEFEAMDSVTQGTLLKKWTLSDEEAV